MDLSERRLARKRASTCLRVQKYRLLRKINWNENLLVENSANNSIAVSSSYMSQEANTSNFENLELSEIDNFQEQNVNSNIQSPTDVQNNFHFENETDNSNNNTTEDNFDVSENESADISSISSNSSMDTHQEILTNIINNLQKWALQFPPLPHSRLDALLNILRPIIPHLPKTSKTFLQTTCKSYNIEKLDEHDNGLFVYFGLTSNIIKYLNPDLHSNIIQLIINVDGLPLFKSSSTSF